MPTGVYPWTKEHKANHKLAMKNVVNSGQFKKGRKCTEKWKIRMSEMRGDKHWHWKGGVTPLHFQIRHHPNSGKWRDLVFKKDKYTCVLCSAKCGNGMEVILNADHYPKTFREIFYVNNIKNIQDAIDCKDFWDVNNGRTLCGKCHKNVTTEWKKKFWTNQFNTNNRKLLCKKI